VIELLEPNDETKFRATELFQNPVDGATYSKWQRDMRANRKKPVDEDGNEIEEDEVWTWSPESATISRISRMKSLNMTALNAPTSMIGS